MTDSLLIVILSILFELILVISSILIFVVDLEFTVSIEEELTVLIDDECIVSISSSTSIYPTLDEDFIFCICFYNNTSLSEEYTGKFTLIAFLLHGIPQEDLVQVGESPDESLVASLPVVSSNSPSTFRVIILSGEYSQPWSYSAHTSSMV